MKISYCTNCHKRLWQLVQTIDHNLSFTISGKIELCVLAYNDITVEPYLVNNYREYIEDGRLKIRTHHDSYRPIDGSNYACGYVKHLSHMMGSGEILFNLDADNFISNAHDFLLNLKPNEILNNKPSIMDGRNGRIGIYKDIYYLVGGYEDKGRADDGYFLSKCFKRKRMVLKSIDCDIAPISNIQDNN